MIRNIYIITFLIINSIFSINAQESNIWLEFDADEITIREGSFMKSFTYKKEKNCGGNIRFSHQIKVSDRSSVDPKRTLTNIEYQNLLNQSKNYTTTFHNEYGYCSKIIEELNKYDNVYILIKEGNQFFEYGVNYRFNRLNK